MKQANEVFSFDRTTKNCRGKNKIIHLQEREDFKT